MIAPYRKLNSPISKLTLSAPQHTYNIRLRRSRKLEAPQSKFNQTHKSRVLKKSTVLFRVTTAVGVDVTSDTPRPYLCKAAPLTEERTPMVLTQSRLGHIRFPTGFRHTRAKKTCQDATSGEVLEVASSTRLNRFLDRARDYLQFRQNSGD